MAKRILTDPDPTVPNIFKHAKLDVQRKITPPPWAASRARGTPIQRSYVKLQNFTYRRVSPYKPLPKKTFDILALGEERMEQVEEEGRGEAGTVTVKPIKSNL